MSFLGVSANQRSGAGPQIVAQRPDDAIRVTGSVGIVFPEFHGDQVVEGENIEHQRFAAGFQVGKFWMKSSSVKVWWRTAMG